MLTTKGLLSQIFTFSNIVSVIALLVSMSGTFLAIHRDKIKESIKAIDKFNSAISYYGRPEEKIGTKDAYFYSIKMLWFMSSWSLFITTDVSNHKYIWRRIGNSLGDVLVLLNILIDSNYDDMRNYGIGYKYIELIKKISYHINRKDFDD